MNLDPTSVVDILGPDSLEFVDLQRAWFKMLLSVDCYMDFCPFVLSSACCKKKTASVCVG